MKVFTGTVVSAKLQKTVSVEVARDVVHPLYGKRMKKTKKFACHCDVEVREGDSVEIVEIRPMSKTKYFKVARVFTPHKSETPLVEESVKPKKARATKEKKSV